MLALDWIVVSIYLCSLLILAWWLGRTQNNNENYYLGSGQIPAWALATSVIATQCSTNSLLGAPAFVGFSKGGGMQWLQYEMAVPLAMLGLCFLFLQIRKSSQISIYAFLENKLGTECRLIAAASFLFFRGVATGVTVYGVASVLQLITNLGYLESVLILMVLTILYDVFGGIKAVVYSDVLQMALLLAAIIVSLALLWGGLENNLASLEQRTHVYVDDWGLSGNQYGIWPMLFGGLFLYMAYYGCDQSQAQRILAAHDQKAATRVLLLNGLCRFPLVFLYCLLGLGLAAYALGDPSFVESLPKTENGTPNINLAFPNYVLATFPPGLVGLVIVGLFAAAMSSIDSALNSLSASTLNDFVVRFKSIPEKKLLLLAKLTTLFWGLFAIVFSFQVEAIAPTVLEVINKVGSLVNGPLLALFLIAAFTNGIKARHATIGFLSGLLINIGIWQYLPQVSWLWWNVSGCLSAALTTLVISRFSFTLCDKDTIKIGTSIPYTLLIAFIVLVVFCFYLPQVLQSIL